MSSTFIVDDSNSPRNEFLKRLIWKERRELTPVWIAIMLIAVFGLAMLAFQASSPLGNKEIVQAGLHSFIAILSATLAIVGFTSESENRTLGRLQNLPLHPRFVGGVKLAVGAIATMAGTLLLVLLVPVLGSIFRLELSETSKPLLLVLLLVGSLIIYFTATAVSMLTRSIGKSLFVMVATLVPLLFWLGSRPFFNTSYFEDNFGLVLLVQMALVAVMGMVSVLRLVPWVEGRGLKMPKSLGAGETSFVASDLASPAATAMPNRMVVGSAAFGPSYGRILWQTWRQSRVMLVTCFLACCLVCLIALVNPNWWELPSPPIARWALSICFCFGVVTLFSPAVFVKDHQQSNYRFFHQNREHPTAFWLARLTPWFVMVVSILIVFSLPVLLILTDVAGWAWLIDSDQHGSNSLDAQHFMQLAVQGAMWLPVLGLMAALGCGQFWSMFIRNPIINTVVTAFTSGLLLSYCFYLFSVNESLMLFAVPVVVGLFLATYVRSRQWLADRGGLVLWSAPIAVVGLTAMIAFGSMAWHRATEYPDLTFDFADISKIQPSHHAELTSPAVGTGEQREATAKLYQQALERARQHVKGTHYFIFERSNALTDEMVDFHQAQKPAIDLILRAAKSPVCDPFLRSLAESDNPGLDRDGIHELGNEVDRDVLLLTSVIYVDYLSHMSNGELELALNSLLAHDRLEQRTHSISVGDTYNYQLLYKIFCERLVQWADSPGQDVKLIKRAIAKLQGLPVPHESDDAEVKVDDSIEQADDQKEHLLRPFRSSSKGSYVLSRNRLEEKLFRLYYGIRNSSQYGIATFPWDKIRAQRVNSHLQAQQFWQVYENSTIRNDQIVFDRGYFDLGGQYVRTDLFQVLGQDQSLQVFSRELWMKQTVEDEARLRRYTLLRLALAAYGIEKGHYPQRLSELASYFLLGLPKTPDEGRYFGWFPDGLGKKVLAGNWADSLQLVGEKPDAPILLPYPATDIDEIKLTYYAPDSAVKIPDDELHLDCDSQFVSMMRLGALKQTKEENDVEEKK